MCFRPAEADLGPVVCPECGKKINRIAGELPLSCPFCETSFESLLNAPIASPSAPVAPAAMGMPSAPSAPVAPAAPAAPSAPVSSSVPAASGAPVASNAPTAL